MAENLLLLQVRFLRQALGLVRTRLRPPDRPPPSARYARLDMPIIVQKYGGTSVDGVERLRVVADRVVRARKRATT